MKVALLGFGTVGVGVYEMLADAYGLEQGPVLVRPGKDDSSFKVTDINQIVNDSEVGAVAEVMGGIEPAFTYVSAALAAGKHVVTSNKALAAAHGPELAELAAQNNAAFLFSAACGGGVPFLHNLALATESDRVISLGGILNGTTNYMLDAMQRRGMDYGDALKDAQRLGYAEADPTADVSGLDALRKIMLACAVAYDQLPSDGLNNEGIDSLTAEDVSHFRSRGLTCRLLAKGGLADNGRVYAFVEPVLLPASAPECSVLDNFNLARYEGENSGPIILMGQGAGRFPTASAVIRDLSCILQGQRMMLEAGCPRVSADNSACSHAYYVRLPESFSDRLPLKNIEKHGTVLRAVTEEISVSAMHETAAEIRSSGAEVFFAAIGE